MSIDFSHVYYSDMAIVEVIFQTSHRLISGSMGRMPTPVPIITKYLIA